MKPNWLPWVVGLTFVLMVAVVAQRVMDSGERVPEKQVRLTPERESSPATPPSAFHSKSSDANSDSLPDYGEYVYVEELPEAITKVAPEYPEDARREELEGSVIVQVLIGRDGRVVEGRIVNSNPPFDEPALAAVRQWTFKPARAKGEPLAVWVAVPVKFTLR